MTEMQTSRAAPRPRAQDVDRYVGDRMRQRRIMLGLTQHQLADLIGVTYQQAHKYEKGVNRIAGGRLYQTAQALGVEVGYFYEGMADKGRKCSRPRSSGCCSSWRVVSSGSAASSKRHSAVWPVLWPRLSWPTIPISLPRPWIRMSPPHEPGPRTRSRGPLGGFLVGGEAAAAVGRWWP